MKTFKNLAILVLFLLTGSVFSQGKFDANVDLETMHYWRGYRVYTGMGTGSQIGYYNNGLTVKVWGGLSIDGKYQEVTPVISYAVNDFSITFSDIDNFSNEYDPRNPLKELTPAQKEYGNYDRKTTNHIMDLALSYDFTKSGLPLAVTWATVVNGGGDFNPDADMSQRYSTYLELSSTFKCEGYSLTPFIGTAFALNSKEGNVGNFYANDKKGISLVNIGVTYNKTFTLHDIKFPITTKFAVNPALKQATVYASWSIF